MKQFDAVGVDKRMLDDFQSFGVQPITIKDYIGKCMKEGMKPLDIKRELLVEKGLREHFRDTYFGSGPDKAKIARETLGYENDVHGALRAHIWRDDIIKWNTEHPSEAPGPQRLQKWVEKSDNQFNKLEKTIRNGISLDTHGGGLSDIKGSISSSPACEAEGQIPPYLRDKINNQSVSVKGDSQARGAPQPAAMRQRQRPTRRACVS